MQFEISLQQLVFEEQAVAVAVAVAAAPLALAPRLLFHPQKLVSCSWPT